MPSPFSKRGSPYQELRDSSAHTNQKAAMESVKSVKGLMKSENRKASNKLFHEIDTDNSNSASRDEIAKFVASNSKLWAMLSVNLDRPEKECQDVATRVAMELASGLQGQAALDAELTKDQFHQFRKHYILDPQGSQEFFHRAVFATFDTDNNAVLDEDELDALLETFYASGSIFQGDLRLPPKEELKHTIMEKYDVNNSRRLSFGKIRGIISGTAVRDVADSCKK